MDFIAKQCSYIGGEAVYIARGLLDNGQIYDDSLLCIPVQQMQQSEQPSIALEAIEIFPNPSTGIFNLLLDNPLEYEEQIIIANTLGQIVLAEPILSYQDRVDLRLENLPKGMYFIRYENTRPTVLNLTD